MNNVTLDLLKQNAELKAKFLEFREIPELYSQPPYVVPFGFIYCIENRLNGRKYIGSTYSVWNDIKNPSRYAALMKRASGYIYDYNSAMRQMPSIKPTGRPIIQAMVSDGIENFVMYPVAETTKKSHVEAENYFIKQFNAVSEGYNALSESVNLMGNRGRYQSAQERLGRSQNIIAVHLNEKKLVMADSMKLLADFIGTSKDRARVSAQSGRPCFGWFVFYLNEEKRKKALDKILNDNLDSPGDKQSRKHSEKSKLHYRDLYNNISRYLTEVRSEMFSDFEKLPDLVYGDNEDTIGAE